MWTYRQSTGQIARDGEPIGTGYSGNGTGKNRPEMEKVTGCGPIPHGWYTIGKPYDSPAHGPFVMSLEPAKETIMYNRDGFLIHGDSVKHPGQASLGCIVTARAIRDQIAESGDDQLTVIP